MRQNVRFFLTLAILALPVAALANNLALPHPLPAHPHLPPAKPVPPQPELGPGHPYPDNGPHINALVPYNGTYGLPLTSPLMLQQPVAGDEDPGYVTHDFIDPRGYYPRRFAPRRMPLIPEPHVVRRKAPHVITLHAARKTRGNIVIIRGGWVYENN